MKSAESLPSDWLIPGTLWTKVIAQREHALAVGALKSITTTQNWIEDGGVRFLVRILANIKRKENAKKQQSKDFNPFLPYEPDMFVTNLSPTHLVLLNKFNVVDHHILIVTRAFESQESLLTRADFQAAALVLSEMDGLIFYNGGKTAGASQPHKHLQLVPFSRTSDSRASDSRTSDSRTSDSRTSGSGSDSTTPQIPIEAKLLAADSKLPYRHAAELLKSTDLMQPSEAASILFETYQRLMAQLMLWSETDKPLGAYNLLLTRQWMCVVPRSQERFEDISINSLGFSGALLVKNPAQLEKLRQVGPMTALSKVGFAD